MMPVSEDKMRFVCYDKYHKGSSRERWWCCYCVRHYRFYPGSEDYETKTPEERAEFRAEMETRLLEGCPSGDCPSRHEEKRLAAILAAVQTLRAAGDPQKNVQALEHLVARALTSEDPEDVPKILSAAFETLTAEAVDKALTQLGIEPRYR